MPDEQQHNISLEEQQRKIEKALKQIRAGLRMLIRTNTSIPVSIGTDVYFVLIRLLSDVINLKFPKTAETSASRTNSQR